MLNRINKNGVTLVEVLISLVILLIVFMGLLQTSLLSIENNVTIVLRDEAVKLASDTVTAMRSGPFDDLNQDGAVDAASFVMSSTGSATEQLNASRLGINTVRTSRNITSNYVITVTVNNTFDTDNKQVTVLVIWNWKGNQSSHQVTALLRRA